MKKNGTGKTETPALDRTRFEMRAALSTFRELRNEYEAARPSRFIRERRGLSPSGSGADFHIREWRQYLRLIEYARDADRNDDLVGTMLDRFTTHVVQDGFRVEPQTGSPELDTAIYERWTEWAEDPVQCDYERELCFADMQRIILRAVTVDGDQITLPILGGSLQLIEAHRCRTPYPGNVARLLRDDRLIHGVELDANRRRVRYWIVDDPLDAGDWVTPQTAFRTYDAFDAAGNRTVFHIVDPLRSSQTRGVSLFAPVQNTLGMLDDLSFAKLVQAQIVSCWAILRMQTDTTMGDPGDSPQTGPRETEQYRDGGTRTTEGYSPGMEFSGLPGERLEGFSPSVPNEQYFPHARMLTQKIGARLSLPYVLLMLDASETNFSGWRGAIESARMEFRRLQRWFIRRFHRPVYRWRVDDWLRTDPTLARLAAAPDVRPLRHSWTAPGFPYINPLQDAQADKTRLDEQLTSPRRLHSERGRDFDEIAEEIAADNALQIRLAVQARNALQADPEIGESIGSLDWRELLRIRPPDKVEQETETIPDDQQT